MNEIELSDNNTTASPSDDIIGLEPTTTVLDEKPVSEELDQLLMNLDLGHRHESFTSNSSSTLTALEQEERYKLAHQLKSIVNAFANEFGGTGKPIEDGHSLLIQLVRVMVSIFEHGFMGKRTTPNSSFLSSLSVFGRRVDVWDRLEPVLKACSDDEVRQSVLTVQNIVNSTSPGFFWPRSRTRLEVWICLSLMNQKLSFSLQAYLDYYKLIIKYMII
jgi:RUN domain